VLRRGLRGGCGFDLLELGFVEAFGFPDVELALGGEPELGAVAEEAGGAASLPPGVARTFWVGLGNAWFA